MGRRSMPLLLLAMAWGSGWSLAAPAPLPPLAALALDMEVACCTAPHGWSKVDAASLDTMRGGFTTTTGLSLSLGIERLVSINGELVSQTNFRIADVGRITGEEARQAHEAINSVKLIQNGANNFGDPMVLGRGTFVQNSLNGQTIQSQTIISSSVNSMSLLKDLNFQGGLRDAAIRAVGTP
jgi:hypothetical protein